MMCDRRYCGCVLRGRNLIRLAAAAFAALAMAGAAATVLQDLLDALLIGLPVLVAGMVVGFVLQVRSSRKQTIRSGAAPVTPAPRPAQAIQPPARPCLVPAATPLDIWALDVTPLDASALDASALESRPTPPWMPHPWMSRPWTPRRWTPHPWMSRPWMPRLPPLTGERDAAPG